MAKKDDIYKRIERINPKALEFLEQVRGIFAEIGEDWNAVALGTIDMTFEEVKMTCFERNLRIGMSHEEAEKEAEKEAKLIFRGREILRKMDEPPQSPSVN